jgi:hypothetical protein
LAIITTTYSHAQRTAALAVWGGIGSAGVAIGVLLGRLDALASAEVAAVSPGVFLAQLGARVGFDLPRSRTQQSPPLASGEDLTDALGELLADLISAPLEHHEATDPSMLAGARAVEGGQRYASPVIRCDRAICANAGIAVDSRAALAALLAAIGRTSVMGRAGIEPATLGLRVPCSTS